MNKEQSADDPSVDLIRVKNMLNSTISMSYPDVVIACIEHQVSLEADAPRDKRTYFREINYIAAAFQYQKKNYKSA